MYIHELAREERVWLVMKTLKKKKPFIQFLNMLYVHNHGCQQR